jgi:hypothetical protein
VNQIQRATGGGANVSITQQFVEGRKRLFLCLNCAFQIFLFPFNSSE